MRSRFRSRNRGSFQAPSSSTSTPTVADGFDSPTLDSRWQQYVDVVEVEEEFRRAVPIVGTSQLGQTEEPTAALGRIGMWREVPWATDNVEVTIEAIDNIATAGVNIGPLVHAIDPDVEMGWSTYLNVLFGLFLVTIGPEYDDRTVRDFQPVPDAANGGLTFGGQPFTFTIRSVNNEVNAYINGFHIMGPVTNGVAIQSSPRHGIYGSGWSQGVGYANRVTIRHNDTPLEASSVPTIEGTPTSDTAAAASTLDLTVPSSPQAGEILVAIVAGAFSGTWTTAAQGWTPLTNISTASSRSARVFWKISDGTETGDVTFTKSSTAANLVGIMFRVAGVNNLNATLHKLATANAQSNTASTSLAVASITPDAIQQLLVWWGFTPTNNDITLPGSYDDILQAGTSVRLRVGKLDAPSEGDPIAQAGTIAASAVSIGGQMSWRATRAQ